MHDIKSLLKTMGNGHMSNTAYDTAWIARLVDIDPEMSNQALLWINEHQLPDGSWGAELPLYYHDRVVCSLSAMIAITRRGRRAQDRVQIEKGLLALERITETATQRLTAEENSATVGFEMIVPTLVAEAEELGIIKQQGDRILGRLSKLRKLKMEKLAGRKVNRHLTAVLSAEMAGKDAAHLLEIDNLQEPNGSVGYSPSTTAYFAMNLKPGDPQALNYLRSVITEGGAPFVSPFNIFERAWLLWNLSLVKNLDEETIRLCQPHLNFLEQQWVAGKGVSFTTGCALFDSDDTSVTYEVLARFGRLKDIEALLSYEEEKHFRCYQIEVNPSVGANVHLLGALRHAGFDKNHPSVQKIVKFLRQTRLPGNFWLDKWHISPYYITAHVIMICRGIDDNLCQEAVNWIIKTQQSNGSWGFQGFSTAEETAYALQALVKWRQYGGVIPPGRIAQASHWLSKNSAPPYPWLWIGKTLYYPELLIQSAILSALIISKE